MDDHYEQIHRLVRKDYEHLCLQELIAEIVIKTQRLQGREIDERYNQIMLMLLGPPKKQEKAQGYKNDSEDLGRVALLYHGKFSEGIEPLKISEAITEVAKLTFVPGYVIGAENNPKPNPQQQSQIEAFQKRLGGKIDEDNVEVHAEKWNEMIDHDIAILGTMEEDVSFTKSLFSEWLDLYGSQPRFQEK